MEKVEPKIASVNVQTVQQNNEQTETASKFSEDGTAESRGVKTSVQNEPTLDELNSSIDSFRQKLKSVFEESNTLSRKVREVQAAQKQKERDFIQARRAIERIRMVSGF